MLMDLAESQRAVEIYCTRRSIDDVQIASVAELLLEIDRDPTGIFWG